MEPRVRTRTRRPAADPRIDPRRRSVCQNWAHGTHLVWAHVRADPGAGCGRGRRSVPVGRGADGSRDHRRHRHVQPSRRPAAAARQGQGVAGRQDAAAVEPRRRVRARRAGRVRGQGGPRHRASGPTATTPAGAEAGKQVSFVVEVDGVHTIHLGDIGHLLSEEKLGDIGSVDIACVPLGGSLSPTKAAALIAQLDPKIVVPMPICDDDADCADALEALLPRDGRRGDHPAQAVGHGHQPADRDDDRPAGVARQAGLTRPAGSAPVEDDPPALDDRPGQVRGRPVRDLGRGRHAPDHEVARSCPARATRSRPRCPTARAALIVTAAERLVRASSRAPGRRRSSPAAGWPSVTCPG